MAKYIMVGCDLHDESMLLKIAVDRDEPVVRTWGGKAASRQAMINDLLIRATQLDAERVIFAYEACGFGFLLCDELTAAGIECHVLATSKMERSAKRRKRKTDERDAQAILDVVRTHVLAGVAMPSVWIPDEDTRDARERVRRRLAVAEDAASAQVRIRWLLKRWGAESSPAKPWTQRYMQWLDEIAATTLRPSAAWTLLSLVRQVQWLWSERTHLDEQIQALSQLPRYASTAAALCEHKGVGLLTAMVFLTELGDLRRFSNRRQIGSFLGLTPSSFESGQANDRKGHITRQGPSRVRKVLCQAVWSRLRSDSAERVAYDRLVQRNPKSKKIAVVARMRVLAVRLWHTGLDVQMAAETVA